MRWCEGGTRMAVLALAVAVAWAAPIVAEAGGVNVTAEETPLPEILAMVAAEGGPALAPHPDITGESLSFATRQMSRTGTARWLCRACTLAVVEGEDGKPVVGRPSINKAEIRPYKLGKLVADEDQAKALVRFVEAVMIRAFEHRERPEKGGALPEAEVIFQEGKLKVLAPPVVHKEVLALLQAMAKVKERGDIETVAVKYGAYDLGFFRASTGAKAPSPTGSLSLDLDEAAAGEAVWALTAKAKTSFYIDPGDPGLAKAKVSLSVTDRPLAFAAKQVAQELGAELMSYDGAWLLVSKARKPLYEGLICKVYYIGGSGGGEEDRGSRFLEFALRRATGTDLPEGMPYAIERIGPRLLACAPADVHERIQGITNWRVPGEDGDRRGWRPPGGWGRGGRGGWGR